MNEPKPPSAKIDVPKSLIEQYGGEEAFCRALEAEMERRVDAIVRARIERTARTEGE